MIIIKRTAVATKTAKAVARCLYRLYIHSRTPNMIRCGDSAKLRKFADLQTLTPITILRHP
jgi:hypothetical protein